MRPLRRAALAMLSRVRGLPRSRGWRYSDRPSVARGGPYDDRANVASDVQGDLRRGDPGVLGRWRQAPRRADHARRLRPGMAGAVRPRGGPDPVDPRAIASSRSTTPDRRRCRGSRRSRSSTSRSSSPTPRTSRPTSRTSRRPATASGSASTSPGSSTASSRAPTRTSTSTSSRPAARRSSGWSGSATGCGRTTTIASSTSATKRELVDADLGVRPELRRREDRGRRGDRRAGRAAAAGRLRSSAGRASVARVDSRLGGGYRPLHAMSRFFYFRRPA